VARKVSGSFAPMLAAPARKTFPVATTPAPIAARTAEPAPAIFRKSRLFNSLMDALPSRSLVSMGVPEVREDRQQIRVRVGVITRHAAVRHQVQLDVDHVVGEVPPT